MIAHQIINNWSRFGIPYSQTSTSDPNTHDDTVLCLSVWYATASKIAGMSHAALPPAGSWDPLQGAIYIGRAWISHVDVHLCHGEGLYWIASTAARAAGFLSMSACSRESLFNPPCHGWASCLLIFYIKPAILGYTPLLTKGQPCNRCCEWARIQSAGDFVRPSLPGRSVRRARSPPSEWKKLWLTNGL